MRLPGARALFLDATAPHTLDSKYPGAAERVLSLYDTLDAASLAAHRAGILALGARHAALMQQAAAHWALACALLQRRRALAAAALDADRLQRFTARLAARTMPRRRGAAPGLQRHRLLSAPTPGKLTVFTATAPALAPAALYALHDPCGAAAARMLAQLAEHARENGYEAILCHCPTDQGGKLDHLFIPERGLGFVTANRWHPMQCPGQKNIHTARFRRPGAPDSRAPAAWYRRTAGALVQKTCDVQTAAQSGARRARTLLRPRHRLRRRRRAARAGRAGTVCLNPGARRAPQNRIPPKGDLIHAADCGRPHNRTDSAGCRALGAAAGGVFAAHRQHRQPLYRL